MYLYGKCSENVEDNNGDGEAEHKEDDMSHKISTFPLSPEICFIRVCGIGARGGESIQTDLSHQHGHDGVEPYDHVVKSRFVWQE